MNDITNYYVNVNLEINENLIDEYFFQENELLMSIPEDIIERDEYIINQCENKDNILDRNTLQGFYLDLDYYAIEESINAEIESLINFSNEMFESTIVQTMIIWKI